MVVEDKTTIGTVYIPGYTGSWVMGGSRFLRSHVAKLNFHFPCLFSYAVELGSRRCLPSVTWTGSRLISKLSIDMAGQVIHCSNLEHLHTMLNHSGTEKATLRYIGVRRWQDTSARSENEHADELTDGLELRGEVWVELDVHVQINECICSSPMHQLAWRFMIRHLSACKSRTAAPPMKISQFESTSTLPDFDSPTRSAASEDKTQSRTNKDTKKTPAVRALEAVYASLGPSSYAIRNRDELHEMGPVGPGRGARGLNALPTVVITTGKLHVPLVATTDCISNTIEVSKR